MIDIKTIGKLELLVEGAIACAREAVSKEERQAYMKISLDALECLKRIRKLNQRYE